MSLLMQALKKAEHAKQQNDAPGEDAPFHVAPNTNESAAATSSGLSLSPMELKAPPPDAAGPIEDLPVTKMDDPIEAARASITAPLIATPLTASPIEQPRQTLGEPPFAQPSATADQAVPAHAASAATIPVPPASRSAAPMSMPAASPAQKSPAAQQAAKTVFASKQAPRQSRVLRLAIFGILAVLVLSAGLGYYFLQYYSQPSTILVAIPQQVPTTTATQPEADTDAQPAEAMTPESAAVATAPVGASDAELNREVPARPRPSEAVAAAENMPAAAIAAPAPPRERRSASARPAANPANIDGHDIQIRQTSQVDQVNPTLAGAYQAYVSGDTALAQQKYQQVLQQDATNRDALLGLAAIAVSRGQFSQAAQHYLKLLELDPADADAIAGLTSLQQGSLAPNESRLKKILADNPQAASVQFVLGNLYAQQSRWAEAQQAYFQAFGSAPGNADYAFNLAVSLDRLSQTRLALDYYQRAMKLAQNGPGNFNKAAVQNRIRELQATVES